MATGDSGCEAYTAIAWGVGLSHERPYVAGAESFYSLEGNICGIAVHILYVSGEHEVDVALAKLTVLDSNALVVNPDPLFIVISQRLIDFALRHRLGQTQSLFSALIALSTPRASLYNDQNTRRPTRLSSFTGVHP